MIRAPIAILLAVLLAGAAQAQEGSPAPAQSWRINNIPLDMPLEEDLNGEYLEGVYQEKLGDRLIDSVGIPWPSYRIQSTLKGGSGRVAAADSADDAGNERMELHFSSKADGARIFWIRTSRPVAGAGNTEAIAHTIGMIEKGFAKADRIVTDEQSPGSAILVIIDTALPADEQARLRAAIASPLKLGHADFAGFWAMDLQQRARVLGRDFRGGIAILNAWDGDLKSVQLELLDLRRAQTVFRLD